MRRRRSRSERARELDAVVGGEALLEGLRELVGEPAPRLVADLGLEAVQYLVEHLAEVVLGVDRYRLNYNIIDFYRLVWPSKIDY